MPWLVDSERFTRCVNLQSAVDVCSMEGTQGDLTISYIFSCRVVEVCLKAQLWFWKCDVLPEPNGSGSIPGLQHVRTGFDNATAQPPMRLPATNPYVGFGDSYRHRLSHKLKVDMNKRAQTHKYFRSRRPTFLVEISSGP